MSFRKILLISLGIILILGVVVAVKVLPTRLRYKQTSISLSSPGTISDGKTYTVKTVIDGDTIILSDGTHVRYLGMDAPEISHSSLQGEALQNLTGCYGQEAKKINEDLVLGKNVRLEFDANKFDRYGRTLAWIYLDSSSAGKGPKSVGKIVLLSCDSN